MDITPFAPLSRTKIWFGKTVIENNQPITYVDYVYEKIDDIRLVKNKLQKIFRTPTNLSTNQIANVLN